MGEPENRLSYPSVTFDDLLRICLLPPLVFNDPWLSRQDSQSSACKFQLLRGIGDGPGVEETPPSQCVPPDYVISKLFPVVTASLPFSVNKLHPGAEPSRKFHCSTRGGLGSFELLQCFQGEIRTVRLQPTSMLRVALLELRPVPFLNGMQVGEVHELWLPTVRCG